MRPRESHRRECRAREIALLCAWLALILAGVAAKKLGLHLTEESETVDTLGGYVFTLLGRVPKKGDQVVVGDHLLEVLQVDEMRIRRLRVSKAPQPAAPAPP